VSISLAAATVASMILSGVQTLAAGAAARNAAEMDALTARQRAEELRLEGETAQLQAQIEARQRIEENRALLSANIARSKTDPYSSPSWLALKDYNDDQTEQDVRLIMFSGSQKQSGALLSSRGQVISANASIRRGKAEFRSSLLGAGSKFIEAGVRYKQLESPKETA